MLYLFRLLMVIMLLLTTACVKCFEQSPGKTFALPDHIKEYRQANNAPKIVASKQFKYDDEYTIPDVKEGGSVNSDALIIPPRSQR